MIGKRNRNMSGQAHIVGAVLIFSIGILVLAGFAFLFNSMKTKAVSDLRSRAADEILDYFAVKASALKMLNATRATTTFEIPARIGERAYIVSAAGDGGAIMLSTQDFSASTDAPVTISGIVDSSSGKAMLIYDNGKMTMRGVTD